VLKESLRLSFSRSDYEAAAQAIRQRISMRPQIGLILGSGLGPLAEAIEDPTIIPYEAIPGWPRSTVHGHKGRLVIGHLEGKPVLAMQGRIHFYEGYSMAQVGFPVRVMQVLGIDTLVVTNAAGGLNPQFQAGDLMLITDHISILAMLGFNPLMGPNDESFGPRFPDFTRAYDPELKDLTLKIARQENIPLQQGVYVCLSGPMFETPADVRMLRAWGADAVGMSTVPEVIAARHGGMRVLGFSSISNLSLDSTEATAATDHEDVLRVVQGIVPRLVHLLRGVLQEL
jgi:purine-nucleoside phosphorylase